MSDLNITKLSVENPPYSSGEHLGIVLDELETVLAKEWQERLDGDFNDESDKENGQRSTLGHTPKPKPFPELSAKEYKTLELLAATGSSNKVIVEYFEVTTGAIKERLSCIYSKLGVDNRIQAARIWLSRSEPKPPVIYYETIPKSERIVAVAHTIAALMSKRPD